MKAIKNPVEIQGKKILLHTSGSYIWPGLLQFVNMSLTVFKCLFGSDNLKRLAVVTEQHAQSKAIDCSNCEGLIWSNSAFSQASYPFSRDDTWNFVPGQVGVHEAKGDRVEIVKEICNCPWFLCIHFCKWRICWVIILGTTVLDYNIGKRQRVKDGRLANHTIAMDLRGNYILQWRLFINHLLLYLPKRKTTSNLRWSPTRKHVFTENMILCVNFIQLVQENTSKIIGIWKCVMY